MSKQTIRKKRYTAYLNQRQKRYKEFAKRIVEKMNYLLFGDTE